MNLKDKLRYIKDFPKEGITFVDITTVLNDSIAFKQLVDVMSEKVLSLSNKVDVIVGTEARGFILGSAIAYKLGARFVPVRKSGKLPYETVKTTYDLEYGSDSLEIHNDAINPGDKVVIIDDLLATGGTIIATTGLVKQLGGIVDGTVVAIELEDLGGRSALFEYDIDLETVLSL